MPTIGFSIPSTTDMTKEELIDLIAKIMKELEWVFGGHLDSLNIRTLTADKITTGTLDAGVVTVRADYTGGAFIELSSTGIRINDGTKDTFVADINGLVTMVGALVQSATGYPRIELNSAANLLGAYQTVGDAIKLTPVYSSGPPALLFDIAAATRATISLLTDLFSIATSGSTGIHLQSAQDLILDPTGNLKIGTSIGFTGTFIVVADVNFVAQTVDYTRVTVKKGIITNVAAV
jgi:hypothetical protein